MSDDITKSQANAASFEERVFARFDALDGRLSSLDAKVDSIDGRLSSLETKVDVRLQETRPIWEGVLLRLDAMSADLKSINRRMRVLHDDILHAPESQEDLRERVAKIEIEPTH